MNIREYKNSDLGALVALFRASVEGLTGAWYNAGQRAAWAPESPDLSAWKRRLDGLHTRVAEIDGELAGFIAWSADGHIDLLYTSPDHAGRGVATALLAGAEQALRYRGVPVLFTEASLAARSWFERQGFEIENEQVVTRNGIELKRCRMRKWL